MHDRSWFLARDRTRPRSPVQPWPGVDRYRLVDVDHGSAVGPRCDGERPQGQPDPDSRRSSGMRVRGTGPRRLLTSSPPCERRYGVTRTAGLGVASAESLKCHVWRQYGPEAGPNATTSGSVFSETSVTHWFQTVYYGRFSVLVRLTVLIWLVPLRSSSSLAGLGRAIRPVA